MALYVTRPRRDEVRIGRGLPSALVRRSFTETAECLAMCLMCGFIKIRDRKLSLATVHKTQYTSGVCFKLTGLRLL